MSDFDNVIGKENKKKPVKILNASFIRELCHERDMKISEEGMKEIAKYTRTVIMQAMDNAKEMGAIVILRRHIEGVID